MQPVFDRDAPQHRAQLQQTIIWWLSEPNTQKIDELNLPEKHWNW